MTSRVGILLALSLLLAVNGGAAAVEAVGYARLEARDVKSCLDSVAQAAADNGLTTASFWLGRDRPAGGLRGQGAFKGTKAQAAAFLREVGRLDGMRQSSYNRMPPGYDLKTLRAGLKEKQDELQRARDQGGRDLARLDELGSAVRNLEATIEQVSDSLYNNPGVVVYVQVDEDRSVITGLPAMGRFRVSAGIFFGLLAVAFLLGLLTGRVSLGQGQQAFKDISDLRSSEQKDPGNG